MNFTSSHLCLYIGSTGSRKLLFNDHRKERKGKNNAFVSEERLSLLENTIERALSENEDAWVCVLVLFINCVMAVTLYNFSESISPSAYVKIPYLYFALPT